MPCGLEDAGGEQQRPRESETGTCAPECLEMAPQDTVALEDEEESPRDDSNSLSVLLRTHPMPPVFLSASICTWPQNNEGAPSL